MFPGVDLGLWSTLPLNDFWIFFLEENVLGVSSAIQSSQTQPIAGNQGMALDESSTLDVPDVYLLFVHEGQVHVVGSHETTVSSL